MTGDKVKRYKNISKVSILLLIVSLGCNILVATYLISYERDKVVVAISDSVSVEGETAEVSVTEDALQEYAEKYYGKQLQKLLTPEEISYLTQRQWEYVLTANGNEFTSNTMYMDGAQNLRIMIAEVAKSPDAMPPDLLIKGSVWQSDEEIEMTDYIAVYSPVEYQITREQQDHSIKYYYDFKDITPGTIISFQMGDVLMGKLRNKDKLTGNRVEVIIR